MSSRHQSCSPSRSPWALLLSQFRPAVLLCPHLLVALLVPHNLAVLILVLNLLLVAFKPLVVPLLLVVLLQDRRPRTV